MMERRRAVWTLNGLVIVEQVSMDGKINRIENGFVSVSYMKFGSTPAEVSAVYEVGLHSGLAAGDNVTFDTRKNDKNIDVATNIKKR